MTSNEVKKATGRMELGEITQHNIKQLRLLNSILFPVSYNDNFYKEAQTAGELARLVYFEDIIVGAVCCRIDIDAETKAKQLYIMTLGCLAPYRRLGVGSMMLEHVLEQAKKDKTISGVFLHVQTINTDALAFYQKSGFEIKETKTGYYKKIQPADAYILRKDITH